jgi:hypothetical protein
MKSFMERIKDVWRVSSQEKRKAHSFSRQEYDKLARKIGPLIFNEGLPFNLLDGLAYYLEPMV